MWWLLIAPEVVRYRRKASFRTCAPSSTLVITRTRAPWFNEIVRRRAGSFGSDTASERCFPSLGPERFAAFPLVLHDPEYELVLPLYRSFASTDVLSSTPPHCPWRSAPPAAASPDNSQLTIMGGVPAANRTEPDPLH
jgi:hypothetical protein